MTDFFISHASEDKQAVARPLASILASRGFSVWFDEFTLTLGDSLAREIDRGLASCQYGVVVLSENFFAKQWPRQELDALITRETNEREKRVLPVWHGVDQVAIGRHSPLLASRLGVSSERGLEVVADEIVRAASRGQSVEPLGPLLRRTPHAPVSTLQLKVEAHNLGFHEGPEGALHYRTEITLTNRGSRAAVLSFQLRFELEPGDPRCWVAIPEGADHRGERLRVDAEHFASRELQFRFLNPQQYGGVEYFRGRHPSVWITDHISDQQMLVRLPGSSR